MYFFSEWSVLSEDSFSSMVSRDFNFSYLVNAVDTVNSSW